MTKDNSVISYDRFCDTYLNTEFVIEVYEFEDKYEAWLYDPDYSKKVFMFGTAKIQNGKPLSKEEFIQIVESNKESYEYDY